MLWIVFWVVVSLLAVVGLLESLALIVELIALRRVKSIRSATLRVVLAGEEADMEYLLNTLCLIIERFEVSLPAPALEIIDGGLDESARKILIEYSQKNPQVQFTETQENDII